MSKSGSGPAVTVGRMTTTHQIVPVLSDLADVLDQIPADKDGDPTPCTAYDLAALRQHIVGWATTFADAYAGDGTCGDPEQVTVKGTGAQQVRDAAGRFGDVDPWTAPGQMSIGGSGMPMELALSMILWEYQVHGWDVAAAAGRPWSPDRDGLAASLGFAPGMLTPEFQGPGKSFGPRVPIADSAPELDRLLGLSGRDPSWRPAAGR